MVTIHDLIK